MGVLATGRVGWPLLPAQLVWSSGRCASRHNSENREMCFFLTLMCELEPVCLVHPKPWPAERWNQGPRQAAGDGARPVRVAVVPGLSGLLWSPWVLGAGRGCVVSTDWAALGLRAGDTGPGVPAEGSVWCLTQALPITRECHRVWGWVPQPVPVPGASAASWDTLAADSHMSRAVWGAVDWGPCPLHPLPETHCPPARTAFFLPSVSGTTGLLPLRRPVRDCTSAPCALPP